jgi:hypothetical protein
MSADFDFEKLSSDTFSIYGLLKMRRLFKKPNEIAHIKREIKKLNFGCLFLPFTIIVEKFGEVTAEKELRKRNADVYFQEAQDLLAQPEFKKSICSSLRKAGRNMVLTEEIFIRTVTEALIDKDLRSRFVIPTEPMLFAWIAFEISETGINLFCAGLHDEE